jgi:acyl-CoA synthetase (AMP-forming)/AMP-acid ligase II
MTVTDKYFNLILEHNSKIAIIHNDKTYTYNDLVSKINYYKNIISESNITQGQIVFIISDYSFESIALFFSLSLNYNIVVPVTTENTAEIEERLIEAKPDWIFNLRIGTIINNVENLNIDRHELINTIQKQKASGLILFSSGSTGRPKAMIHNLDSLLSTFLQKKARTLNFLVFLMFDHIGGLNTLFNCLSIGSIITIPENRRPDHICFLIEKFKINILPSSPTFLNLMLIGKSFEKYDLSSLKMITYGTETMPESLLIKLKNELPSIKFIQTFGTSETGIAKTTSKSSESTLMKIEDPDQEYQIVDGELWLRSKTQILGYINHNNDSFTNDGWFKTGDLVEEFDGGYLKIVGRSKEVINVGGEKVLPTEIESVILELPEILDCKAKGVNNSITGQMVVVDVVAKKEYNTQEIKLLVRNHCRLRLDAYKVPAKIKIVDGLEFSDRFKKVRL